MTSLYMNYKKGKQRNVQNIYGEEQTSVNTSPETPYKLVEANDMQGKLTKRPLVLRKGTHTFFTYLRLFTTLRLTFVIAPGKHVQK